MNAKDEVFKTSYRSNLCGILGLGDSEKSVLLCGWVDKRRDHGKLIFVDLRDFSGMVQLVFDPSYNSLSHETAKEISTPRATPKKPPSKDKADDSIKNCNKNSFL